MYQPYSRYDLPVAIKYVYYVYERVTISTGPANGPQTFQQSMQNVCGFPSKRWSQVLVLTKKEKYYFKKQK